VLALTAIRRLRGRGRVGPPDAHCQGLQGGRVHRRAEGRDRRLPRARLGRALVPGLCRAAARRPVRRVPDRRVHHVGVHGQAYNESHRRLRVVLEADLAALPALRTQPRRRLHDDDAALARRLPPGVFLLRAALRDGPLLHVAARCAVQPRAHRPDVHEFHVRLPALRAAACAAAARRAPRGSTARRRVCLPGPARSFQQCSREPDSTVTHTAYALPFVAAGTCT
jgi:hypothetical protein